MSLRDRIRALRAEAALLEPQADEQERATAYVQALREERRGWEYRLAVARQLGAGRERIPAPFDPRGYVESERTGLDLAAEAEGGIEAVDAELARVGG